MEHFFAKLGSNRAKQDDFVSFPCIYIYIHIINTNSAYWWIYPLTDRNHVSNLERGYTKEHLYQMLMPPFCPVFKRN